MSNEHVELARLIMGRTTTAAVEAILAAGYSKRAEQVTEIVADSSKVFMVVCQDPEAHARSYNEGYEAAVTQGLADDPSLAGDWLDGKLAEAFAYGWREGKGIPTPVNADTKELLHEEAEQPDFNPYRREEEPANDKVEQTPLPPNHPSGMFEWSAFGANYPDTSCEDGLCTDHDGGGTFAGIPCPFCLPAKFYEYQWGGGWVVPTCYECQEKLPPKTPLTFHDGPGLTFSAHCPKCQAHTTTLMREYETDRDDVEVWVAE